MYIPEASYLLLATRPPYASDSETAIPQEERTDHIPPPTPTFLLHTYNEVPHALQ